MMPDTSRPLTEYPLVLDDVLSDQALSSLRSAVIGGWIGDNRGDAGWRLAIKPNEKRYVLSADFNLLQVVDLFDQHSESTFRYWYYTINRKYFDTDAMVPGLVRDIDDAVNALSMSAAIASCLSALNIDSSAREFSVTAYDRQSFIDSHTDFSDDESSIYELTLIYYLGCLGDEDNSAGLHFETPDGVEAIQARRNRAVLFAPSRTTRHWVEKSPERDQTNDVRFAISGWFMSAPR